MIHCHFIPDIAALSRNYRHDYRWPAQFNYFSSKNVIQSGFCFFVCLALICSDFRQTKEITRRRVIVEDISHYFLALYRLNYRPKYQSDEVERIKTSSNNHQVHLQYRDTAGKCGSRQCVFPEIEVYVSGSAHSAVNLQYHPIQHISKQGLLSLPSSFAQLTFTLHYDADKNRPFPPQVQ